MSEYENTLKEDDIEWASHTNYYINEEYINPNDKEDIEPLTMSFRSSGCGCCSVDERTQDKDLMVKVLEKRVGNMYLRIAKINLDIKKLREQ